MSAPPEVVSPPPALPRRVRIISALTLLVALWVSLMYVSEATALLRASSEEGVLVGDASASAFGFSIDEPMLRVAREAHLRALQPLRAARIATLSLLTVASMVASVAAMRLLFPRGLARGAMRQLLVGAAFAAAFLRTIDGAQSAVLARKVASAIAAKMRERGPAAFPQLQEPGAFDAAIQWLPTLSAALVAVVTGIVTLLFVACAQFFRTEYVRGAIDTADVFGDSN